jgi:hypothetical protein
MTPNEINFFRTGRYNFLNTKGINEEILEKFKLEPVDKKLRKIYQRQNAKKR